jgi:hypothetical protein
MTRPSYQCQVCGLEASAELIALMTLHEDDYWYLHRIECKGGIVQVLTCPACNTLSHPLILESYKDRIRLGLIPGFQ